MVFKTGPMHLGHSGMIFQMTRHGSTIFTVPLHAEVKGFQSPEHQEAIHGAGDGTT